MTRRPATCARNAEGSAPALQVGVGSRYRLALRGPVPARKGRIPVDQPGWRTPSGVGVPKATCCTRSFFMWNPDADRGPATTPLHTVVAPETLTAIPNTLRDGTQPSQKALFQSVGSRAARTHEGSIRTRDLFS